MHGDRYRRPPALQQRLQIVEERVVGVRGICHTLPTSYRHAHRHVIVQHPVVAALRPSRLGRLLVAGHRLPQAHRFARDACRAVLHLDEDERKRERERDSQFNRRLRRKFAWKAAEMLRIARRRTPTSPEFLYDIPTRVSPIPVSFYEFKYRVIYFIKIPIGSMRMYFVFIFPLITNSN